MKRGVALLRCYYACLILLLLCGCIGIPLPTQTVAIEAYNEKGEFIPYEELKVLVFSVPRRRSYGGVLYQPVKVLSVKPNGLIEGMPKFSGELACDIIVLVFTKASYLVNIGTIVSDACGPFQLIKTYNKEGTNYYYPHRLIAVCLPTKDSDSTIFRQIVPSEWRTTILQAKGYSFFLDKEIQYRFTLESLLCPTKTQEAYLSQYNFWEERKGEYILDGNILTPFISQFKQYYWFELKRTNGRIDGPLVKFAIETLYRTNID